MTDAVINLEIPFPEGSHITFAKWLPMKPEDSITLSQDNLNIKLSFKIDSTWWATQYNEDQLQNVLNVHAYRVYATCQVKDLDDELVEYIISSKEPLSEEDQTVALRYDKLASDIYKLIIPCLNRMISYARAMKGQYWVKEFIFDPENFSQFFVLIKRKIKVGQHPEQTFLVRNRSWLTITMPDENRYISNEEWPAFLDFISSEARPPLVRSLLAVAVNLLNARHNRSAIIEAVSALEICLSEFSRNPALDKLSSEIVMRLNLTSLTQLREKLGLRGTFDLLIPLLFTEEILSMSIISKCRKGIKIRNNVVHNGQREIETDELRTVIFAIENCCKCLENFTKVKS